MIRSSEWDNAALDVEQGEEVEQLGGYEDEVWLWCHVSRLLGCASS